MIKIRRKKVDELRVDFMPSKDIGGGGLMESYIVRVYHRDEKDPAAILGMVEIVQTGVVEKFADWDELYCVICNKPKKRKRRVKEPEHL